MQNNENRTDRLFRDKLLNHEILPPQGVWENIVNSLDSKNRRKRIIWIFGLSVAASLLFAFLAGWYFASEIPVNENFQANVSINDSKVPSQPNLLQPSNNNNHFNTDKIHLNPVKKGKKTNQTVLVAEIIQRENIFIKLLSPANPLILSAGNITPKLMVMNSGGLSDADREIIARNLDADNDPSKSKKDITWAIGIQASPVYHFEQATSADFQNTDPLFNLGSTEVSPSYKTNVSTGIKFEVKTGSRFSVQSGVNYGEIAQNGGELGVSFAGQNWLNNLAANNDNQYFGSVKSLPKNMILKTNMGLANIGMPGGTELSNANYAQDNSLEATRNYNLEQQAGYLEIPLVLRYKIIDSKLGFHILGGINTNILMSNRVSLVDKKEVIANGKIEGLNPVTFSSSFGMGVNYAISNHFNLSFEPTLKIQLNSLNKLPSYDSRPYAVGIFTGLSYNF